MYNVKIATGIRKNWCKIQENVKSGGVEKRFYCILQMLTYCVYKIYVIKMVYSDWC